MKINFCQVRAFEDMQQFLR